MDDDSLASLEELNIDVDYSGKNKEFGEEEFDNQKYIIRLEFTEDDYNAVKNKLKEFGQTAEKVLYDALIPL